MKILLFTLILIITSLEIPVNSQTLTGGGGGGGGGGSGVVLLPLAPPPAPSRSQNQMVFADKRLEIVYPIIQKFKNIITSDPLNITSSWTGTNICNYKGFFCESPPDNKSAIALTSVDFNGFQLTAPTLDGFLDQLPDIALFHANSNNFSGTISPNIAKLPFLYELDLSNNQFSGPFPTPIVGMNGLIFLDVRFNLFSGSVPPQLFTENLDVLFLNNNNFMTTLPDTIETTHIVYLTLANNRFFGPIPPGIAEALSNSTEILLLNNRLSGCLPFELGYLTEAVVFDAGNNQLTGPLPFSLGCLRNLEVLNFAGNLLYGTVPEVVCALGNLANLSLSENYFTHVGQFCSRLIDNGVLDLKRNCIPGLPFQRSVEECAAFFAQARYCPYMPGYVHVPCVLHHFNSSETLDVPVPAPSPF